MPTGYIDRRTNMGLPDGTPGGTQRAWTTDIGEFIPVQEIVDPSGPRFLEASATAGAAEGAQVWLPTSGFGVSSDLEVRPGHHHVEVQVAMNAGSTTTVELSVGGQVVARAAQPGSEGRLVSLIRTTDDETQLSVSVTTDGGSATVSSGALAIREIRMGNG